MSKAIIVALVVLVLSSMAITFRPYSATAQETAVSVVDALDGDHIIELPLDTPPGTKFLVNITIRDVQNLAGWQINITYNPKLLNIAAQTDVFLPPDHILKDLNPSSLGTRFINNTQGWVMWACSIGPATPGTFNGSGTMCQIRFTTMKDGTTDPMQCWIVLDRNGLFETEIVDKQANDIAFTTENGLFRFISAPPPPPPPPAIAVIVNINPAALNLKSKGKSITALIELPDGYKAKDVDFSTIMLNRTIHGEAKAQGKKLMVKFDRTAVSEFILSKGIKYGNVTLTLTGKLLDGTPFEGSDTITVRMSGDVNGDGKVDVKDILLATKAYGSYLGQPSWNPAADQNEDGKIDLKDIEIITKNYGKTYQ